MIDIFIEGLATTVVGMLTVFLILIMLCGVLYLLRFANPDQKKKVTKEIEQIKPIEIKPIKEEIIVQENTDNTELIAVITAAIAASLGTTSNKLQIKSIVKVQNWNAVTRREQQRTIN